MANVTTESIEKETCTIIINGEKLTMAEYKKSLKASKKTTKKTDKPVNDEPKEVSVVASTIEQLVKPMTALKSLQVYKTHAYRSWGTIANEIMAYRPIKRAMASYCVKFSEFNDLMKQIKNLAKKNEKAIYQYVEKLSWKLDDMKADITAISKAVNESGVCNTFKGHEAINGVGRQLGLKTVITKCLANISTMEEAIKTLQDIVDKGTDPFKYGEHMSFVSRKRCWA